MLVRTQLHQANLVEIMQKSHITETRKRLMWMFTPRFQIVPLKIRR
nr:MAG TPA: hypothetical protein [Caudoviricetes sp.]